MQGLIKFECPHCAQSIEGPADLAGQMVDCPTCQKEFYVPKIHAAAPETPPPPRPVPTESDELFLREGGIIVTKTRFIAGTQTFTLANITSLKPSLVSPDRRGPVVVLVFGFVFLLIYVPIGVAAIIGAIVWMLMQKSMYSIVLTTAASEVEAFTHPDRQFILRVVDALSRAIIARE